MKKQLAVLVVLGTVLLAGCGSSTDTAQTLSGEQTLTSTGITMSTKQAIQDYLVNANKNIQEQTVVSGDTIVVDYIGRLDESTVFDTSLETIARAAGKYTEGRDYTAGLEFTVGAGQMIAGFDAGVVGMHLGETKTISIPADQAYGLKREDLIITVPLETAGDLSGATVGAQVLLGGYMPATITAITDKEITFDANRELAGKDLIFDVTVKNIKSAQ